MLTPHLVTQTTGVGAMTAFRSRVQQLLLQRSVKEGRPVTQRELSNETGISYTTVQRLTDSAPFQRLDAPTLYALMDYFACTFEELIERVEGDDVEGRQR